MTEQEHIVEAPVENGQELVETQEAQAAPMEQETAAEKPNEANIRVLREKAKQAEKYERELEEYRRQLQSLQQKKEDTPSAPELNLGDDDIAEGKHLRQFEKKVKDLEKKLQSYEQKSTTSNAEMRLKTQYPDIEKVVTQDNLKTLQEVDPDLFMSLQYNPDVYSKGSLAYRQIKSLGIYKEDKFVQQKDQVTHNMNKPRPANSLSPQQGESPLSHANAFANGLTPELKKKLYKEMLDSSK